MEVIMKIKSILMTVVLLSAVNVQAIYNPFAGMSSYMPSLPSMDTLKSYVPSMDTVTTTLKDNKTTIAVGACVAGLAFVAYKGLRFASGSDVREKYLKAFDGKLEFKGCEKEKKDILTALENQTYVTEKTANSRIVSEIAKKAGGNTKELQDLLIEPTK